MMKILVVSVLALACLGECAIPEARRLGPQSVSTSTVPSSDSQRMPASTAFIPFAPRRPVAVYTAAQPVASTPLPVGKVAGLRLDSLTAGALPAAFHLESGDRILRVNGEPATSIEQLREAAAASVEGTAVELQVVLAGTDEVVSFVATR